VNVSGVHVPSRPFVPHDQQMAKFTRLEKANPGQAVLGETLREVQTRIKSLPSSFSRMMEEALAFLEEQFKNEKSGISNQIRSLLDTLQTVKNLHQVENEDADKKIKTVINPLLIMGETFKTMLDDMYTDAKETASVLKCLEESVEDQTKLCNDLLETLCIAVDTLHRRLGLKDAVVINIPKEPLFRQSEMLEKSLYCNRRVLCPSSTNVSYHATNKSLVRNFTCAVNPVQSCFDFSAIMEVDSDTDDECEE